MSADILSTLLAANIAASAVILLVVLIRKPAQRMMGARLSYWLWLVPVLAGLATLLPPRPEGPAPAAPIQPIAEATVRLANSVPSALAARPQAVFDIVPLLIGVWAAGVVGFLALMLLQQWRTLRALKLTREEKTPGEALWRADSNFGPAVVGVLKPLLVAPADFEQRFSPSEQALVLAHEREHLAAGHTRINAAQVVLISLNWFNPLVHWAARLARADQELACDAAVMERFPRQRGVYAEALLKAQISRTPLPLGCTWPSRSSHFLIERVTMLANKTPGRARRMAGAAFIAVTMLGTGLAAWAQQSALPGSGAVYAGGAVSVDKDGRVVWNGKAVEGEALKAQAGAQATSGAPHIRLSVDPAAQYVRVVPVIEQAQRAGMRDITFAASGVVFTTPTPPPAGSPPPCGGAPCPDPVRLFVDFDGAVFWNGKVVDMTVLVQNLAEAAKQTVPPELHIEPHKQAPFGRMEELLTAIRKAGLKKVGIIGGGVAVVAGNVPPIIAGTVGN